MYMGLYFSHFNNIKYGWYVVFIKYIRFINRVLIEEKPVNNLVDGFVFVKKYLRVLFEFNFFE